MPIFIVVDHKEIRKVFVMKKIFLLILFSVFSSGSLAADFFAVKYNSAIEKNEIWRVSTENSTETKLAEIRFPSNAWSTSNSFLSEKSGEIYLKNAEGYYNVYNPKTNTFREVLAEVTGYQKAFEIPNKFVDDMISVESDDAEIKIDEANSTVNIDNAAISDGDGKNIIAVETDGSTTIGDNSLKIIDVSGTLDIQDGAGKTVIKTMSDGSVHIGENSLVSIEQNGRQYLYGTDVNGDMIDIDIKAGSDFRIHGISVLDSLRGLGDGVEGSAALTAALSSVPSSAPDYEYYCGGGLGAYGSSQAAALGCAKDHSETLSFHAGASYLLGGGEAYGVDEFSDFAFKAGFTYKFGKKSQSNPVETASINAAALSASSTVEQTKLKAQVNDLSHKLAVMEKKLEVITASMDVGSHMDKLAMAR